ncbi:YdaU family protein [Burkholderia cenocepacia]|uniref:YdaU family protein n=1 Tax=Burkholderia cenocepacia TaxID=95486 RepID=UPI001F2A8DD6|nr:YdaU family protein [Burkholderia cenocepacia]MCF1367331.1 YdaU family protein [Burkholderia cenocepacia]MCF1384864.1 YdaU family protein [Burkholderia cenocepacia]
MNYYERYCGDYQRDTAHLSLTEHGAFTMLLDTYYATEKPLGFDSVSLFRICRAMTPEEQAAVVRVADEFFPISEDGLRHNKRADALIASTRAKLDAKRENGKKGGRPKKPTEPTGKLPETEGKTETKTEVETEQKPTANLNESSPTPTPVNPSVSKDTGETPSGSQGELLADSPAGMTAQEAVWSLGVPMLVAAGQADRSARSLLGKWCKAYGPAALQAAIVRCAQENPLEPVSWLIKALGAPKAADGGEVPRTVGSAPGGDWWAKAGFAKEYEATNAGCSERYAHLWRNGEKIPDAERRAMAGVPR